MGSRGGKRAYACSGTRFLWRLDQELPDEGWWEPDVPIYWIVNYRYRRGFPVTDKTEIGRNVGWTSWTHSRQRQAAADGTRVGLPMPPAHTSGT